MMKEYSFYQKNDSFSESNTNPPNNVIIIFPVLELCQDVKMTDCQATSYYFAKIFPA